MERKKSYKVFASEQRVKLLLCLSRPHNVNELLKNCTISQSALSQHLKILREAGVVTVERQGKHVVYQVRDKTVLKIAHLLQRFTSLI